MPARSGPGHPSDLNCQLAQHKHTGHINGTTLLPAATKNIKALFFSNDDGQMSLPPALLNLVDQAKDALWALTACIFHPSAKVKINGRTCAYTSRLFLHFR